jgi:hypothetical protein
MEEGVQGVEELLSSRFGGLIQSIKDRHDTKADFTYFVYLRVFYRILECAPHSQIARLAVSFHFSFYHQRILTLKLHLSRAGCRSQSLWTIVDLVSAQERGVSE